MKVKILLSAALIFIIGLFFVSGKMTNDDTNEASDKEKSKPILITINWQENVKSIAEKLKEKKLIKSKWLFYWHIKKNDLGSKIKAGTFIVTKGLTRSEIANIITGKSQAQTAFTIPEGYTIAQIDKKLAELQLITEGDFIACTKTCEYTDNKKIPLPFARENIEGYLFPDTYFIDQATFSNKNLIERMLDNFTKKITPEMLQEMKKRKRTLNEVIIMASILEKEIKTEKDLATASGILWKRLNNNWTLGADATILYVTNKTTLDAETLNLDSLYNTRKFKGLPPTPIGNPGLKTILAAINPKESQYWYYLTTAQGEVVYAETNEEHVENKRKYLQ